ncbi:hypothetical protein TraAM80_03005 [Trypanosoma rangeli]|uniref:Uncharacterized protein n=1 Tax=Trypanosoma rangeli TaxID=5698 RepID=A0A3R7NUL2_TRYRA|nr:uncharacterized protein TraAM80_03005 [Trypanosoma rangeli]RNF07962.1 hypothetical protein TraAM80_03005 [Trypanosoma rangeli]|eukprot:RNF07962.1 hypothetical protein TraAM80_03005 [Trypanosoma rangeli]
MDLEELRRGIEVQEQRVAALRQEKQRRDALLSDVRAFIGGVEPYLFDESSCDVRGLVCTLMNNAPMGGSPTTDLAGSSPRDMDPSIGPRFSREMEERIAQAEEPLLQDQVSHKERRSRSPKHGKKKRGRRGNKEGKERQSAVRHVEACLSALNDAEINAREALTAALDSLQLEPCGALTAKKGVPPWLSEAETQHQQKNMEESEGEFVEAYYSDDFEELTDLER